tara:strand:+ start:22 stop:327 length:306 start_codon:yes stop_codon:yes gene_type:complete
MKYWRTWSNGYRVRIEWNESATFNLQTRVGNEWVDYDCFTVYDIESAAEALKWALDHLKETDPKDQKLLIDDVQLRRRRENIKSFSHDELNNLENIFPFPQ